MRGILLLVSAGLLLVGLAAFSILFAQTTPSAPTTSDLERPIHACEMQVAGWRRDGNTELTFVIIIFIGGIVIAILQKKEDTWAKVTAGVLGIVTAILTGVNSRVFTADDKTLKQAAFEGQAVISQLYVHVDTIKDPRTSDQDRISAKGEYLKLLVKFQEIGDRLGGKKEPPAASGYLNPVNRGAILPSVYASVKAKEPAWVRQPPSDSTSLYYVGKASAESLTLAKQYSEDDAYHKAVLWLRSLAPNASDASLLSIVKSAAVTQDFLYTLDGSQYTYYTLIRVSREIQGIGVRSLPTAVIAQSAPIRFQGPDWRPADLAANTNAGLFALDSTGAVSRLVSEPSGLARFEKLFKLNGYERGYALAAGGDAIFVTSSNRLGCTVYRYSLTSRALSQHLVAVHERCAGIATDGTAFYVSLPTRGEIRYWDNWDSSSTHSWPTSEMNKPGYIIYDNRGHRLLVADASGTLFAISVPDGKKQLLASNLGTVQSIATSRFHLIVASGKKALFLSRFENTGENPPAGLRELTGGQIVGVAVDSADRLWFADSDRKLVTGPFPLS